MGLPDPSAAGFGRCSIALSSTPTPTNTGFYTALVFCVTNTALFLEYSDRTLYISGEEKQWLVLGDLGVGTSSQTTVGTHLPELCGESFHLILLTSLSDGPQVLVILLCFLQWVCGTQ